MFSTVVVDVVEGEELDRSFPAAPARDVAAAVVKQRGTSIPTETGYSLLVVTVAAPGERSPTIGSQIELDRGFLQLAMRAELDIRTIALRFEPTCVMTAERRARQAVLAAVQVADTVLDPQTIRERCSTQPAHGHRTLVLSLARCYPPSR
jgi:hypothetical protein